MDNSTDARFTVCGWAGNRSSDPARLCCALTHLSRILASYVPRTETRMDLLRGLCQSRAFRVEEIE
jgi:hypothetical protein